VPTVADFRRSLIGADVLDIVDTFLLSAGAAHVSNENLNYIANSLAATYGVNSNQVDIVITGSAKLGFSISERGEEDQRCRDIGASRLIRISTSP
jgi:hypothetical protein